jgi:hypothetical protein
MSEDEEAAKKNEYKRIMAEIGTGKVEETLKKDATGATRKSKRKKSV